MIGIILASTQDILDYIIELCEGKELLIIFFTILMCFAEAILPMIPLVVVVNASMILLKPLLGEGLGVVVSLIASISGSLIGCFTVFIIIKKAISKKINDKISKNNSVQKTINWIRKRSNTFLILLLSNPYTPTSIVNYSLALVGFDTKRYITIMGIGRAITIILLGLFGIVFNINNGIKSFIFLLLIYTLIYLIIWIINKKIERKDVKMKKKTIKDVELKNKVVLMRVDFNVPMKDGKITDENRIVQALPTIKYALDNEAKLVLFSHLGRVKEEADKANNSLAPVAVRLQELLNKHVEFVPETRGEKLENAIKAMKAGDIVMFENTRFEDINGKKESKNDPELGKYWASLGDLFVNDAFGTAHRAHASNAGIAANLDTVVAGFLMEKEITFIGNAVDNPVRPFVAILGGAKVSDKISVIENLINKADKILICGAMAYTFYKALGYEVGTSKCELDFVDFAKGLLEKANGKIILPVDTVVAKEFAENADSKVVDSNKIPADEMGMDIGPKTLEKYKEELKGAKTVVWNGPAGVFEFPKFAVGTNGICEVLANLEDATTIIGGGDSAAAAIKLGYADKFTHISTGGGASLEYLEGKALPGVEILNDK